MASEELSRRERRVLEAVIRSYVETAEPAGSRTLSRRFGLGVSPATIRNTMSDLEEKGFLFHPHTSAGRVPTNKAYRVYVDSLLSSPPIDAVETERLAEEIAAATARRRSRRILRRAAQTLGVLTQELGVALGPRLDVRCCADSSSCASSSERLLMVLTLEGGVMRTVFVEVPGEIADVALGDGHGRAQRAARRPDARRDPQRRCPSRLRDVGTDPSAAELLNIFVQEGEQLLRRRAADARRAQSYSAPHPCSRSSRSFRRRTVCVDCSRSPRSRRRSATRFASARRRRASRSRLAPSTTIRARGFHRRDGGVSSRFARRCDRRDRSDANALRQSHFARQPHIAAAQRSAGLD